MWHFFRFLFVLLHVLVRFAFHFNVFYFVEEVLGTSHRQVPGHSSIALGDKLGLEKDTASMLR